ncbi:unnamed protein product [Danaus chrysippus]|uniref:(African queen) hypothetical protein n=1 Tax=Danaus chrysippus TaxID=151541 RepID=A0A8J2QNS5_9NEOP|nr:unnamed protein product [Danaus chrysippus]
MAESGSQSLKNERPEIAVTDTEDDRESLCPPPSGPSTRSTSKRKTPVTKPELELSILLKFIKPYDGRRDTLNSFIINCRGKSRNAGRHLAPDTRTI